MERLGSEPQTIKETPKKLSDMLEAFQKPEGIFDSSALENTQATKSSVFTTRAITAGNGQLNQFFSGVSGAQHRKTNDGKESVEISGGTPSGVILKK